MAFGADEVDQDTVSSVDSWPWLNPVCHIAKRKKRQERHGSGLGTGWEEGVIGKAGQKIREDGQWVWPECVICIHQLSNSKLNKCKWLPSGFRCVLVSPPPTQCHLTPNVLTQALMLTRTISKVFRWGWCWVSDAPAPTSQVVELQPSSRKLCQKKNHLRGFVCALFTHNG